MIAQIVPLRRLPPWLDNFDYQIPASWPQPKLGQLAMIPFKGQTLTGVIVGLKKSSSQKNLRPLTSLLEVSLTKNQLELAAWLSRFYHLSPALLLRLMAPVIPQRNSSADTPAKSFSPLANLGGLPKITNVTAQAWLIYNSEIGLLAYLQSLLKRTTVQTLIVIPDNHNLQLLAVWSRRLAGRQSCLIMPKKTNKKAYWQAWQQSQTVNLVIGNWQALLLPFKKLGQIIVIETDNLQFHQAEQSPRLHLKDFLQPLAKLYQAKLLLTTVSPNLELFYDLKKSLPLRRLSSERPQIKLVDLEQERRLGNYDLLSEAASQAVKTANGPALLYLNKLDYAKVVRCRDCQWQADCCHCGQALAWDQDQKNLRCWNCLRRQSLVLKCPACGGSNLKGSGAGLQKLQSQTAKQFPDKKISLINALTAKATKDLNSADIILATSAILSQPRHWAVTVMVDADQDLRTSDFQAGQNLRRQILKLNLYSQSLFIQTRRTEHYVFRTLDDWPAFYQQELAFRQTFGYPPLVTSYKIFLKGQAAGLETERINIFNLGLQDIGTSIKNPLPYQK